MGFDPQNELERSLMKAARDPAYRPQVYRDLVKSDIFIIEEGRSSNERDGWTTAKEGTRTVTVTLEVLSTQRTELVGVALTVSTPSTRRAKNASKYDASPTTRTT
jgi:hypothetical protein